MPKKKLYTATFTYDGKRYYVRSSKSQREADRRAAKKEAEMQEGLSLVNADMTVDDYFERWVDAYKKGVVSKPVYASFLSRYRIHISPVIGSMRMRDVKPIHCQEVLNACTASTATADKLIGCLRSMFRQAVDDDILHKTPASRLKMPALKKERQRRSITTEERAAILQVAEHHPFGMFVKIMLYCGLRPQEVCVLEPTDIDVIHRRIMVRRALKKEGHIGETKSAAGRRDVPIPPRLWDDGLLEALPLRTVQGKFYSQANQTDAWRSFLTKVNLALGAKTDGDGHALENRVAPDLQLYCLRHTYCTDLEAAGVPINVAKYLMGHSSITMTARIYTHMRDDTLEQAAAQIASFGATAGATEKAPFSSRIPHGTKSDTTVNGNKNKEKMG